ncbi:MAG: serine peptidase, partial [Piscirickettsiaceae bacterium]|nr:serine peptidase [Piscirickettsiaceae bacterium]
MKQLKVWAWSTTMAALLMLSLQTQARSLPEFTELVSENSAAVINISTTKNNKARRLPSLPKGMEIPEGTPLDDMFKHF